NDNWPRVHTPFVPGVGIHLEHREQAEDRPQQKYPTRQSAGAGAGTLRFHCGQIWRLSSQNKILCYRQKAAEVPGKRRFSGCWGDLELTLPGPGLTTVSSPPYVRLSPQKVSRPKVLSSR